MLFIFIRMVKNCYIFILICGIAFLTACSNETTIPSLQPKDVALGKMNEIVVVADQNLWDGATGDSIRYYLQSPYPLMPAPEAMFDLRHFTPSEIEAEKLRRQLRTYTIIANLEDLDSPTTKMVRNDLGEDKYQRVRNEGKPNSSVGRNKWAQGQLVIYLYANGYDQLNEVIKNSFPAIAENVHNHDRKQLKSKTYPRGINIAASKRIKSDYGIALQVPIEYKMARESDNLLWFRKDDPNSESVMNMAIQKFPYTGTDQFEKGKIVELCNAFGSTHVSSDTPGSHMQINDRALPVLEYTQSINQHYTKEIRGVWEMTEDFMGGPFVAYLMHLEDQNELVFIYSFVYAPSKEKRNMVQQLDFMVKNLNQE